MSGGFLMIWLLRTAGWNVDGVRDDLRGYVLERLGDPGGVWVVDETGLVRMTSESAALSAVITSWPRLANVSWAFVARRPGRAVRGGHSQRRRASQPGRAPPPGQGACDPGRHRGRGRLGAALGRARVSAYLRGLPANDRRAPARLVEGAVVQGWKQALGALALTYPDRIGPYLI
jgi:hypothetical protein